MVHAGESEQQNQREVKPVDVIGHHVADRVRPVPAHWLVISSAFVCLYFRSCNMR
jgi:hypothetical protein